VRAPAVFFYFVRPKLPTNIIPPIFSGSFLLVLTFVVSSGAGKETAVGSGKGKTRRTVGETVLRVE
jgi:hypothetical protein